MEQSLSIVRHEASQVPTSKLIARSCVCSLMNTRADNKIMNSGLYGLSVALYYIQNINAYESVPLHTYSIIMTLMQLFRVVCCEGFSAQILLGLSP